MSSVESPGPGERLYAAIVELLRGRYGDGLVYLRDEADSPVYLRAVSLGYISDEGYLTAAGRTLLARNRAD